MKKWLNFLLTLMLCALPFMLSAQQDPAAEEVLKKFNNQAQNDYPIEIDYEYFYESRQTDEFWSEKGKMTIDDEKFWLAFRKTEVFYNGKTMWNWNKAAKEVYISEPDPSSEDFFLNNPGMFFKVYQQQFKYQLLSEQMIDGNTYYEIDLYPNSLEKPYSRIRMLISKSNYRLFSIASHEKDGEIHTVKIVDYKPAVKISKDTFTFDPSKYPDLYVEDMRF